jgi:predicted N-acetyltransferase YhbS
MDEAFGRGMAAEDVILLKDRAGEIRGFLASWHADSPLLGSGIYWSPMLNAPVGGMGPLGIDEQVRGHGLGLALVEAGATALKQRGVAACVIDWTTLPDFYARAGFQVFRSYWRCAEKSLTR